MGEGAIGWSERRHAWLAVALVVLLVLLINPVGYSGGGRDDTRYLEAARCWVEAGRVCLPHDHWTTRWPAIAPLASAVSLGGLNRTAVGLGTLPSFVLAVALVGWLGRLWFSRKAGLLAAALFAAVPAVSVHALRPNVDMIELAGQLAALGLGTLAVRERSIGFAIAAGVCAGLAVAARDTSFLFAGIGVVAWFLFAPGARKLIPWAIVGFAGVIGIEMLAYALAAGDPLLRFNLALAHGSVPSTELASWVDTSRSPILNPQFIAGWKMTLGIKLWWPIDPWLNLFGNPQIGPWVLVAPLAAVAARDLMNNDERRKLSRIGWGSILIALAIVYVLAIDPKTRAFLLPLAGATLILGWAIARMMEAGKAGFALILLGSLMFLGFYALSKYQQTQPLERAAERFIRSNPGKIEIDPQAKGTLLLAPGVAELPLAPAGRPLRMLIKNDACPVAVARALSAGRISLEGSVVLDDHSSLCLVRYR